MMGFGSFIVIVSVLMFVGVIPLVILQVQAIPSVPSDGSTYATLTAVRIEIPCPYSSDKFVWFDQVFISIDNTKRQGEAISYTPLTLTQKMNTMYVYEGSIVQPSEGSHTFLFGAGKGYYALGDTSPSLTWNLPYYWTEISKGSFQMQYSPNVLTGDWYIAGTKIISATQVVTVYSNNIAFKFVKTSPAISDEDVTVSVSWSGTESGSVSPTAKGGGVWESTVAFENGEYNVDLTATDGTTTLQTLSVLQIGSTDHVPKQPITAALLVKVFTLIVGLALVGSGYYVDQRES